MATEEMIIEIQYNGTLKKIIILPPAPRRELFYLYLPGESLVSSISYDSFLGEIFEVSAMVNPQRSAHDGNFIPLSNFHHIEVANMPVDYEYLLYRWIEEPEILVFDFISYETQALWLKRLAFFVEKPGFRGTILTDEELEGKHGWNAHDYDNRSLADFFNRASEEVLNPQEQELRRILINQEIIILENHQYIPGNGAIISISQESSPVLRQRFLVHEAVHGLFFTNEDFKNDMFSYWNDRPQLFQEAWKTFLYSNDHPYDSQWEFLVVNEMAAYFLQNPPDVQNDYFHYRFTRAAENKPENSEILNNYLEQQGDSFSNITMELQNILKNHYSLQAGDFYGMDEQ